MDVIFLRSFLNDIKKVKDKNIKDRIKESIETLKLAKNLEELPHIKKLKGYSTVYRFRVGDYRMGMYKEDDKIVLARFVKRNDIYKLFPKKGSK